MSDDRMPRYASVWDTRMHAYLTEHARIEGELLGQYVDAAERSDSKAFTYLVNLLAEDERRHHRQFAELAASLRADATLKGDEPLIPRLDFHHADVDAVLELTRTLIANEQRDAEELKQLRKDLREREDTTLWALLVESMQYDTAKHLAILTYVERLAKAARR